MSGIVLQNLKKLINRKALEICKYMQIKQKIEGEGDNENCTGQRMKQTFVIAIPGGNTAGSEAVPIIVFHFDSSTLSCYVRVQMEWREERGLKRKQFQLYYYHSMDLFNNTEVKFQIISIFCCILEYRNYVSSFLFEFSQYGQIWDAHK